MVAPQVIGNPVLTAAKGDADGGWLEQLVRHHGPGIRRMLRRMLGNEDEVLDVYQESLCQLLRRCQEIPVQCARAYAYRTAANLAVETIRRRRRHEAHWPYVVGVQRDNREAADSDAVQAPDSGRRLRVTEVRDAVRALPRHLHDVVVLRDLSGLSYARVAAILGIRPTTARVYRRQAIVRLGGMLAGASTMN
jgi:RNA polymerase sigma-70 factor (ECF subfamily)